MANKTINFVIKVNNKEVDLSKTSFKQFDEIIKQAKKDLQGLPLSDPRYKTLVADIKTAESAWKGAQKSASELGDEMDKGEEKTKTYTAQIKELVKANIALKDSGQGSSQAFQDNEKKIKALRDEQEAMTRSTQKLDDALSNIPGPIGQIGQGMQQLESVSQSATSAFKSLGLGFDTFDKAIKTSGVGALVLLIVTLVAAVVDAAKKSEPLQQAFAVMGDAVGALFDAIKPLSDFLINVFVKGIELVANALNGIASLFGGVNKGFKQQSLALQKELDYQKSILDNFNSFLSTYYIERLKLDTDYATKKKEIIDKTYKDEQERTTALFLLEKNYQNQISELDDKQVIERHKKGNELIGIEEQISLNKIDNARTTSIQSIKVANETSDTELRILQNDAVTKKQRLKSLQIETQNSAIKDKDNILKIIQSGLNEQTELEIYYRDKRQHLIDKDNSEIIKLQRQYTREDIAAINDRSNQILQLTTELIKEENARNLKAAQDTLIILKEQHRKEIEDVNLSGVTKKKLVEKQIAEDKVAKEKVRLAQIQYDAYLIDLEINKQNRLAIEAGIGTKEYFDAREEIITKSFEKEILLADKNADKVAEARNKQWKAILELDKEKLQEQINLYQKQQDGLYEGTVGYFNKQRELEIKRFDLEQLTYQNNYDMQQASKLAHEKNMTAIDVAQIRATADLIERRAATEQKLIGQHYDDLRLAEELKYQTDLKMAGDNALAKETLLKEHNQRVREINNQQIQDYAAVATAMLDMLSNVGSSIAALYEVESQDTKKTMKEREAAFEKNKQYQKATAYLSAASGIIQILTQPSTLPSPFDWIVKIGNAAALGIMTAAQIKKIDSTKFSGTSGGSGGGSGSDGSCMGKNYGDGGMIEGPLHSSSQGGVPIMAEGGEAVMTRGAVTMFRPLLSMMNQAGGGTSFTKGAIGQASFDNPKTENNPMQEPIIKTYVVESELTTIQHKQARLKDLSTL
jgi:hypothetical protein